MDHAVPFALSILIAFITAAGAWRSGALTLAGAFVAFSIGTAALSVSWGWGALLIGWFLLASLLSAFGRARKAIRVGSIVEKGNQRDARQVLANGGVFFIAACAVIFLTSRGMSEALASLPLAIGAAGSLAAAGADTWATEIGTLCGSDPWSLRNRSRVPAGTSGAVTTVGSVAMIFGSLAVAVLSAAVAVVPADVRAIAAIAIGGVTGALLDTVIGAWLQERCYCNACGMDTEQEIHVCGGRTIRSGGIAKLDNDFVNACCSLAGGLTALLLVLL